MILINLKTGAPFGAPVFGVLALSKVELIVFFKCINEII